MTLKGCARASEAERARPAPGGVPGGAERLTHEIAQRNQWPWLPTQGAGVLAPHPFCTRCGQVRAVGTGRAMDLGGLVNLLANLGRRLRDHNLTMTEVQRRLILKRLVELQADDAFGLTRGHQRDVVAGVAGRVLGLHRDVVASYLCSC